MTRVLVVSLAVLLAATACTGRPAAKAPAVPATTSASPAAPPSPRALTAAQAEAALITAADLGEPWTPTQGAATWRDGVLKATTEVPDCRHLLDALYADDLFGTGAGAGATAHAVTGLDDAVDQAQLRYQVLALPPAEVDRTLEWMRTLPGTCGRFTAVTQHGAVWDGQVTQARLPAVGDARQGLRVSLAGETEEGEPVLLTLDVVAVRAGDDTIALTNGGLGDVSADVTQAAVETGVRRLAEVRRQGRVQV
ncbi:hypothetical protein ACYF6T_15635 [Streptomyces sp. 7R007]